MSSLQSLVWLVTGCSSGMGAEFIKAILKSGDRAIATARNVESLRELADLGAATLQLDVTASADEIQDRIITAVQIYGHIDVLISNAGYAYVGVVENLGDDLLKIMQTNTFGAINVLSAMMPHWRERKQGFLVVNSSAAAWWDPAPGLGAYSASKGALDRLIQTFALEMSITNPDIKTLIIEAGHHRTNVTSPEKRGSDLQGPKWNNYEGLQQWWADFVPSFHGNQDGDAAKACSITIDLVRNDILKHEGVERKELPPFLPLGVDAFDKIKARATLELEVLEEWEDVIKSTHVPTTKS